MKTTLYKLFGAALLGALLVSVAFPTGAAAQGWEKVKKDPPPQQPTLETTKTDDAAANAKVWDPAGRPPKMLNVQVGYPLVLSPRFFMPLGKKQQIGGGIIFLPGLFGLNGEYRYYFKSPKPRSLGFYAAGGATLYSIRSNDRVTSPLGFNIGGGAMYRTTGDFAYGGELGYMAITGSKDESIKSFGLYKGKSTVYVNFQVSYIF